MLCLSVEAKLKRSGGAVHLVVGNSAAGHLAVLSKLSSIEASPRDPGP
jgi:hypothetical protein